MLDHMRVAYLVADPGTSKIKPFLRVKVLCILFPSTCAGQFTMSACRHTTNLQKQQFVQRERVAPFVSNERIHPHPSSQGSVKYPALNAVPYPFSMLVSALA